MYHLHTLLCVGGVGRLDSERELPWVQLPAPVTFSCAKKARKVHQTAMERPRRSTLWTRSGDREPNTVYLVYFLFVTEGTSYLWYSSFWGT